MDKRPFTCCFTGHRILPAGQEEEIWRRVYACLEPLLEEGVRYFGVGGALGFDTLVAEKLLALRESHTQIRIILVQPFLGYQRRWTGVQQSRAAAVESRVDRVVVCCQRPSREAFFARDRHLVDGSSWQWHLLDHSPAASNSPFCMSFSSVSSSAFASFEWENNLCFCLLIVPAIDLVASATFPPSSVPAEARLTPHFATTLSFGILIFSTDSCASSSISCRTPSIAAARRLSSSSTIGRTCAYGRVLCSIQFISFSMAAIVFILCSISKKTEYSIPVTRTTCLMSLLSTLA